MKPHVQEALALLRNATAAIKADLYTHKKMEQALAILQVELTPRKEPPEQAASITPKS